MHINKQNTQHGAAFVFSMECHLLFLKYALHGYILQQNYQKNIPLGQQTLRFPLLILKINVQYQNGKLIP